MKRTAALRITADICFFFAVLNIYTGMQAFLRPMALFAVASLAVSLAAVYCSAAPVRFLLALLPGLAFLTGEIRLLTVIPALAWLYLILMVTSGRFHIPLESYRRAFRIEFAAWISLLVACLLLDVASGEKRDALPAMLFALAFLFLGVLAMRRMQMNADVDLRWTLANGAVTAGIPLAAAGLSAAAFGLLRLLRPLSALIAPFLAKIIAWVLSVLFGPHPENLPEEGEEGNEYALTEEETQSQELYENPPDESDRVWEPDPAAVEKAARVLTWVLIALALAAAVFLIVRIVRRNRAKADQEAYLYEETADARPARRRKAEAETDVSNERRIRRIYRAYMMLMQKRGIRVRKDTTSGEILYEEELFGYSPDARRLRELYLKARYADGDSITEADAEEAEQCLRKIREDDSWKKERAASGSVPVPVPEADSPNLTFESVRRYLYNDYMQGNVKK